MLLKLLEPVSLTELVSVTLEQLKLCESDLEGDSDTLSVVDAVPLRLSVVDAVKEDEADRVAVVLLVRDTVLLGLTLRLTLLLVELAVNDKDVDLDHVIDWLGVPLPVLLAVLVQEGDTEHVGDRLWVTLLEELLVQLRLCVLLTEGDVVPEAVCVSESEWLWLKLPVPDVVILRLRLHDDVELTVRLEVGLKDLVNVVVELSVWLPVTEHVQELVLLRDPEPEVLPVGVRLRDTESDLERLPVAVVDTEHDLVIEDVRDALVMLPLVLAVGLLLRLSLGV